MTYFLDIGEKFESGEHISNDTRIRFETNKKLYGTDWIWYNTPVTYTFNSSNLRMNHDVETVLRSDYIIFFGCSYTVGVGVPLEKTYAYLVSSSVKMPYINAGIAGASPEYVFLNILNYLSTVPKKPNCMIVNWPDDHRGFFIDDDKKMKTLFPFFDPPEKWRGYYKDFILNDVNREEKFLLYKKLIENFVKSYKINYFQFTQASLEHNMIFSGLEKILHPSHSNENTLANLNNYWARDIFPYKKVYAHYGIKNHEYVANKLIKWITNL